MKSIYYIAIAAITLFIFQSSAHAAGYVGLGYGETDYDAGNISSFDDPSSIEFFVGFKPSENLGFEIGYVNFGEADDGIPPEWHLEATSLAFSLLGIAPVGSKAEAYFQFGLHMWDIELSEDGFGKFAEDDGNDFFYGIGFRGYVNEQVGLGVRYNKYTFDGDFDSDVTRLVFNAQFAFE